MIKVFKFGRHAHRTPLSYPALEPFWSAAVTLVDSPDKADLYLCSHSLDAKEAPRALVQDWRQRRRPLVLLSEEPFWDTIWGQRPLDPLVYAQTPLGDLPVLQINHQTSPLFAFERIPYYLLTNPRFEAMYAARFARNAALSPKDWQAAFATRPMETSFMFERRPEPWHSVAWPEADLAGLCAWRTEFAMACDGPRSERLGKSWQGTQSRFDVKDWYADKMHQLDGRAAFLGAFENTHQRNYVTEKLFDAFACGALPLYTASPEHRAHSFGLPPQSWINCHGLSPAEAAAHLGTLTLEERLEDFAKAQTVLLELFGKPEHWQQEKQRFGSRLVMALERALAAA